MLRTYALAPETLRKLMRQTFWRFQLFSTLSFLILGLYLVFFARPVHWPTALPLILLVALVYFLVIFFTYRQQLRNLYSIRVELDGSGILYRQVGQELRISRADIAQVREVRGGLWIESQDPDVNMFVPSGLARDGDLQVRQDIAAWIQIDPLPVTRANPMRMLRLAVFVGALLILLFANHLWVVIAIGLFLLLYGMYAERRLGNRPAVQPGMQRMYSMAFSFLIFVVMVKSCMIALAIALNR